MNELHPDPARLQGWLDALSAPEVGGTGAGGVSRPAASAADGAVRDRFAGICRDLGLEVSVDDGGNMYGLRQGSDPAALPVVIGSHLDTVVPGGRFDGILGVAAALETVAVLNDAGAVTRRPLIVVDWMGEEGARFPPAMLGSGLVTGVWDAEYLHSRTDAEGRRLGDELAAIGYLGSPEHRLGDFFASLEIHIEQGTQLEEADAEVGIVPFIEPVRWCTVRVRGRGGHAGGPGPKGRREAIVAASRMVVAARNAAVDAGDFKTTVGRIDAEPGSNNVIPHQVSFALDVRSADDDGLDAKLAELDGLFRSIAEEEGVEVEIDRDWSMRSAPFDPAIRDLLAAIATRRRVAWKETRGHIGHDSLYLAAKGPAAMLFTRTRAGVSHSEAEFAPWSSILATVAVFAEAAQRLADADSLEQAATDLTIGVPS